MFKRHIFFIAAVFLAVVISAHAEEPPEKKYFVIFADFGGKQPPEKVIGALKNNPELKLTFVWPGNLAPSEEIKALAREKRVELALSFTDEPAMPLVYDTLISTPIAIKFSWPEDVWNIVFRAKDEFRQNTQIQAKGMYLRSGLFTSRLVKGLKKLGIYWSNYDGASFSDSGAVIADGFLALSAQRVTFSGAQDCWKWMNSSQERITALVFSDGSSLNAEFLAALAGYIRQSGSVKLATPELILAKLKDKVPALGERSIEIDPAPWARVPLVWHELSIVRKTIEDYNNSGYAKLETLEKLREQLYGLYSYRLLENIMNNSGKEYQDAFQNGLTNIYAILGLPVDERLKTLPGIAQLRPFSVELSTQSLVIVNSGSAKPVKSVNEFVVTAAPNNINYFIDLDTSVVQRPLIVDIYMDLNNQEGAGLTKLLPGLDTFLEVNCAWEYAIRIENGRISLYRAGRFDPVQIKQFSVQIPWEFDIPRSVLRGNPLSWGYQVITAVKREKDPGYDICDFLAKDDETRQKLLGSATIQLPAFRAQTRGQIKKEN